MRVLAIGTVALLAAGCNPTPRPQQASSGDDPRFQCNASQLGALVGQPATTELGTEAQRLSNARTIRWIRPDTMSTMDHRTDRLNIHVDANSRVVQFMCG